MLTLDGSVDKVDAVGAAKVVLIGVVAEHLDDIVRLVVVGLLFGLFGDESLREGLLRGSA